MPCSAARRQRFIACKLGTGADDAVAMRTSDDADEALLLQSIDRWVARELKPIVKKYDRADRYSTHVVEQMKEAGVFRATVGADVAGWFSRRVTYPMIMMRISAVWMGITSNFNSHLMLAAAVIRRRVRARASDGVAGSSSVL
jgi:alkylation response protein AidB-like acyl-CoA dehydrogenase